MDGDLISGILFGLVLSSFPIVVWYLRCFKNWYIGTWGLLFVYFSTLPIQFWVFGISGTPREALADMVSMFGFGYPFVDPDRVPMGDYLLPWLYHALWLTLGLCLISVDAIKVKKRKMSKREKKFNRWRTFGKKEDS
jgi:hypothetical protein